MPINNLNQMPSQVTNTLISEGAAVNFSNQIKTSKDDKKTKTIDTKNAVTKMIESDNTSETSISILQNLVSKAFDAGIMQNTTKENKTITYDLSDSNEKNDDKKDSDIVNISSSAVKKQQKNIIIRINLPDSLVREFKGKMPELVEEYAGAYYEYIFDNKSKKPQKLEKIELMLKEEGLSDEKIHTINKEIRNIARADMSTRIKESYVFGELAGSKIEKMIHEFKIKEIANEVFLNSKFGGDDLGGYNNLFNTMHEATRDGADEVEKFARDELENRLMAKMLNNKDIKNEDINEIIKISQKKIKNFDEWLESIWPKKKDDLGFVLMNVPEKHYGNIVNTTSDNSRDQNKREKPKDEQESSEEKLLINQLRAIYTERLINGKKLLDFGVDFKIRRLKNGLIKLGIFSKDLDEKINFEAETYAKGKIMDDLRDLLLEKAALFRDKGHAAELIAKKKDALLKSAKRLGIEVSDDEFKIMQDAANRKILISLKKQIELYEELVKKRKDNVIESELAKFKKLESKLNSETAEKVDEGDVSQDLKSEIA